MSSRSDGVRARLLRGFLLTPVITLAGLGLLAVLPHRALDEFRHRPFSPNLVDRNGEAIQTLPLSGGLWREYTPVESLPSELVAVFQRSEDNRFYAHFGVDVSGMVRALIQNTRAGRIVSGGSSITMQLARLIRPHSGGVRGKLSESVGAIRLEAKLSKRDILDLWINSIPFGSQVEGVTSAAWEFFGVSPGELSTEQELLLAVIPRRPESYNPRVNPEESADAAAQLALRIGVEVSTERLRDAARHTSKRTAEYRAPHFVRYVAGMLGDDELSDGHAIVTTLDLGIQDALDAAIRARVRASAQYRIGNGAGIVLDNVTGGIVGYVGSIDYFDEESSGQIDGVRILRQPGSTLKPFLYALAMEKGFTAASILPDVPTDFGGREIYVPQNFNRRFNGPVRLRTALASSLNVPAVYTIERLGVKSFATYLVDLGFDSIRDQLDTVGTGLALGNAEVSLAELTRAFAVFIRDGNLPDIHWEPGKSGDHPGTPLMPSWTAGIIRDILADRRSRITGFGTRSIVDSGLEVLFKTGTSSQFNNIWAVGSSSRYTVGVWMGNFGGETVIGAPGSSLPAAVVLEILGLFTERGSRLPSPQGVHRVDICATSGLAATENCPAVISELFHIGQAVDPCNWHVGLSLPVRYPPEFQSWAIDRDYVFEAPSGDSPLRIVQPSDGAVFYYDPTTPPESQAVRVEVIGGSPAVQVYLNDALLAEGPLPLVSTLPVRRGTYELTAIPAGEDHEGGATRARIEVR